MNPFTDGTPIQGGRILLPMQMEGASRENMSRSVSGDHVDSISIPEAQSFEQAWFAVVSLGSGRCIHLTCSCTEVGDWVEHGTINVELTRGPDPAFARTVVPTRQAFVIRDLSTLVVDDARYQIEAGLVVISQDGRELVAIAGEIPGAFSLQLPDGQGALVPPYPLHHYRRVPLHVRWNLREMR